MRGGGGDAGGDFPEPGPSTLAPIPEGDHESGSESAEALSDYLVHEDPELQQAIDALVGDWCSHLVEAEQTPEILQEFSDRMPLQYYHGPWLNMETYPAQLVGGGFSDDQLDAGGEPCVELGIIQ